MSRGLDHIVHAVRSLDVAADFYSRLGFTVGPRNRHPWGTHNHIVQLPGFFVELLAVAETDRIGGEGLAELFGRFNQRFLEKQEGLSFLMLESPLAAADARDFAGAGIALSSAQRFEREGKAADGSPVTLGFSLAFAHDGRAPQIGFATCQKLNPQNFWNPALQQHPNAASSIAGVVIVAENPSDHHIFLSAFTGERELSATSGAVTVHTPRGDLTVMDGAAFRGHFGVAPPDVAGGARLAAIRFAVRDQAVLAGALAAGKVAHSVRMGQVVVPAEAAMGATLVFAAMPSQSG
jgi:hypothetical protein